MTGSERPCASQYETSTSRLRNRNTYTVSSSQEEAISSGTSHWRSAATTSALTQPTIAISTQVLVMSLAARSGERAIR
jgi:hypothetical protein